MRLAAAAHEGVLGLLGVAALPPDVIIEQTAEGPPVTTEGRTDASGRSPKVG